MFTLNQSERIYLDQLASSEHYPDLHLIDLDWIHLNLNVYYSMYILLSFSREKLFLFFFITNDAV